MNDDTNDDARLGYADVVDEDGEPRRIVVDMEVDPMHLCRAAIEEEVAAINRALRPLDAAIRTRPPEEAAALRAMLREAFDAYERDPAAVDRALDEVARRLDAANPDGYSL